MKTKKSRTGKWFIGILLLFGLLTGPAANVTDVRAGAVNADAPKQVLQDDPLPASDPAEYWTPERMQNAIPYDVIPLNGEMSQSAPEVEAQATGDPGWSPSTPPDGWTGTLIPTGAAGTVPAPAQSNTHVTDYVPTGDIHTFPYSAAGKIYFTMLGQNHVCSGSVIGEYAIWTAAHCVIDGHGNFHTNWVFIPMFDNYTTTVPGPWYSSYYITPMEFGRSLDLSYDYAIVGVRPPSFAKGNSMRHYTGALGFAWNMPRAQNWKLLGYPMGDFDGIHMVYSDSTYWTDGTTYSPNTVGVGSKIKSGGSGGPWILNFAKDQAGQINYLNGTNSYINTTPGVNEVYSPYLDDRAKALWDCAQFATPSIDFTCFAGDAAKNLTLTYLPSSDPVPPNVPFASTVSLHNPSLTEATNIVLDISATVSVISANLPGGSCTVNGNTAHCTLASLAAGGTANVALSVNAPSAKNYSIVTTARVKFDQQAVWDYQTSFETKIVCSNTLTVTNTNDSGAGSLRQALDNVCASGTINFNASLSGATIRLASQLAPRNVTIDGSALVSRLTISGDTDNNGTGDTRVFSVSNTTLDSLIITKGNAGTGEGGGIAGDGTIKNCIISDNHAGNGGGISTSYLTLINSVLSGNSATGNGGGIYVAGNTAEVANSTFSGNTASNGGGIYVGSFSHANLVNDTISANSASVLGGGTFIDTGNGATLSYTNTVIANSTSGGDCSLNGGTPSVNLNNLVEDGSCSATLSGDPKLDALADNGGATQTMALLPGSPAFNAGDDAACAAEPVSGKDQRGVVRPQGTHCDIGAVEMNIVASHTISGLAGMAGVTVQYGQTSVTSGVDGSYSFQIYNGWTGTVTPVKAGYTFSLPSNTYTNVTESKSNENYSATPNIYTVTFDGNNGGIPSPASKSVTYASEYGTLATVSRTGYTFAGWYTQTTGGTQVTNTTTVTTASNHTLHAQWTADSQTLTFNSNGGTSVTAITQAYDTSVSAPANPTKVGYAFAGWYTDDETFLNAYTFPHTMGLSATIHAKWMLTVQSITLAGLNPIDGAGVDFTVTFNKPVSGVDKDDFSLTKTGSITGAFVSGVSGSGATYTVTVYTGVGNGTIRLDLPKTATIQDPPAPTNAPVDSFTTGEVYTIKGPAPTVPVLKLPKNKSLLTTYTPKLEWGASSQVMALATNGWHYEIQVTAPYGAYNETFKTQASADPALGLGASTFTIPADKSLPANATFTWKVRAFDASYRYSAWSKEFTFRTGTLVVTPPVEGAPTVPTLKLPKNKSLVAGYTLVLLDWNDSTLPTTAGSLYYEVRVTSPYANYNIAFTTAPAAASEYTIPAETILPANSIFTWQARSAYNDGTTTKYSAWSKEFSFRTKLATPTLLTPTDDPASATPLDNIRPTFVWEPVSGAATYTIQVSNQDGRTVATGTVKAPTYTFTPKKDLLPSVTYTWKVKANGKNSGEYSDPFTFITGASAPSTPTLTAPRNNALVANADKLLLTWIPGRLSEPAAESYEVEYATNAAFLESTTVPAADTQLTLLGGTLLPGRTYYWRVRAWSATGATSTHSPWSAARLIKVKFAAPTLAAPIAGVSVSSTPTFEWSSANGLWTTYTLQIASDANFKIGLKNFTIKAPLTTFTLPAKSALIPDTYYWRVRINGIYTPIPSDTQSFVVVAAP